MANAERSMVNLMVILIVNAMGNGEYLMVHLIVNLLLNVMFIGQWLMAVSLMANVLP